MVLITRVLAREGGVRDVGDGAGLTRFGQTPRWLSDFGLTPPTNVREAAQNYQVWLVRTRLIGVCDYPDSLADAVVDFAVNSGHRTAIRELQRALRLHVDGVYGPETQQAIDTTNRDALARLIVGGRIRYLGDVITEDPAQYGRFARGWMNRVASQVEALR